MPHGWSHKDKSPSVPAGLAMGEGMTRYAIAPPRVGARFIVKQPIWKPGALTRGFGTARGYPGNRHRWRDQPATTWTSCLRGFRKRKITAWSLKHLRRGAVVDSDEMPIFGRQRKPATSTQTRTGAITRCSGTLRCRWTTRVTVGARYTCCSATPSVPIESASVTDSPRWSLDLPTSHYGLRHCRISR